MCQFCLQHGEGKKWYLEAKNYSEDLMSDARRRKFVREFFAEPAEQPGQPYKAMDEGLDRLNRAPGLMRDLIGRRIVARSRKMHYGQVVPLEDVEQIFGLVNSIIRTACVCRMGTYGPEKRFCYGVSLAPPEVGPFAELRNDPSYRAGPAMTDAERLTREEALADFKKHERDSLCHTVWTFVTPFIGGVCNCDRQECQAIRSTFVHRLPFVFRGEYVAEVDPDVCTGCKTCMRACQFGALGYSPSLDKAVVEPRACYGCGICRAHCAKAAIRLVDRASVPVVANVW